MFWSRTQFVSSPCQKTLVITLVMGAHGETVSSGSNVMLEQSQFKNASTTAVTCVKNAFSPGTDIVQTFIMFALWILYSFTFSFKHKWAIFKTQEIILFQSIKQKICTLDSDVSTTVTHDTVSNIYETHIYSAWHMHMYKYMYMSDNIIYYILY